MAVEPGLTQDWQAPSLDELRVMGFLRHASPHPPTTSIDSDAVRAIVQPRSDESWPVWRCRMDADLTALAERTAFADRPNL